MTTRKTRGNCGSVVRLPMTEAIQLLAEKAGYACGEKLLQGHIENCEAHKGFMQLRADVDDMKPNVQTVAQLRADVSEIQPVFKRIVLIRRSVKIAGVTFVLGILSAAGYGVIHLIERFALR